MELNIDDVVFCLWSFIYPKLIINKVNMDPSATQQAKVQHKQAVLDIHYFSYKFSIERLQILINQPSMILFILYYILITKLQRIHLKDNMNKHKEGYYEALELMLNNSIYKSKIVNIVSNDQNFP
jgi:hypothetical protein